MVLAGNTQKPADPGSNPSSQPTASTPTGSSAAKPAADPGKPADPAPSSQPVDTPGRGPVTTVARAVPQTPVQQYPPPVSPPVQQQQPPAYQPPVQQHQPTAPDPNRAALNEIREHHNELAIRAETARGGLQSIKQQMANQGLGLRADIREAETRMNFQLREATAAIRAGDVEGAKRNLEMASRAIDVIERFLGR